MRFDILTLFPGMFDGPFRESIVGKAQQRGLLSIHIHNIRDYATDKHHTADDYPYGGGAGMVMKVEPAFAALADVLEKVDEAQPDHVPVLGVSRVVLMSPQGRPFRQAIAQELSRLSHLVLICGHYEGVDERIRVHLVDDELSIGDYVLTGGEIPAMVVVDSVARLLAGVLHEPTSPLDESFSAGLLEYPQYTRPYDFRGWTVPDILLSGDHGAVARWRREQSLLRTLRRRPDLLETAQLSETDRQFLAKVEANSDVAQPP